MTQSDETRLANLAKMIADEIRARPATAPHLIASTTLDVIRNAELATMAERARVFAIIRQGIRLPFDAERTAEIQENPIDFLNQVIATLLVAFETNLTAADAARALSARNAANPRSQ